MAAVQKRINSKTTKRRRDGLASCLLGLFLMTLGVLEADAFLSPPCCFLRRRPSIVSSRIFAVLSTTNGEKGVMSSSQNNQLMHIMLRVPNVNATIDFWTDRGAHVHSYRKTTKTETAFVGFADNDNNQREGYFALEITKQSNNEIFNVGNIIRYFGLSMLMGTNLMMTAAGESSGTRVESDPNGIEVRPVASAPGDSFARICLQSAPKQDIFAQTIDFYQLLGMELVAADDTMICLRYSNDSNTTQRVGVATTLVFEKPTDDDDFNYGNCFDHMAISTPNVNAAAEALKESFKDPEDVIFLQPSPMFGTTVMGLKDPNGYKVYLVEK